MTQETNTKNGGSEQNNPKPNANSGNMPPTKPSDNKVNNPPTQEAPKEPEKKKTGMEAILSRKKVSDVASESVTIAGKAYEVAKRRYANISFNADRSEWSPLPKDLQEDVTQEIGSFFRNRAIFRPLDYELENFVMPGIIGLKPHEQDYSKEVKNYWLNWSFEPLSSDLGGTDLDITTVEVEIPSSINQDEKVKVDFPLHLNDYITYIMCRENKQVCYGEEDMKRKNEFAFVLVDKDKEEKIKQEKDSLRIEATMQYTSLISTIDEDRDKLLAILELLKDPGEYLPPALSNLEIAQMLMQYSMEEPYKDASTGKWRSTFLEIVKDPNLEMRAFLTKLVQYGIVTQNGNDLYNGNENIGSGYDQAIKKLNDPTYSGQVQKLKSILIQKRKEEIAARSNKF